MIIFDINELKQTKIDHPNWVLLIADAGKNPKDLTGKWKTQVTQTPLELDTLIERIKTSPIEAWNYGPKTGLNNLATLDFDWEWVYYSWKNKFKERANTLTFQTPNKGYRVLYYTLEKGVGNPFKESIHTELLTNTYVAVGGYALDVEGAKQPYTKTNDASILQDNNILQDTKNFLTELQQRYDFLGYKCIKEQLGKHIKLNHEQRLAILNFMLKKKFPEEEIHDFYKTIYEKKGKRDYEHDKTQDQIESGKEYVEDGGLPHPCQPKINPKTNNPSIPLYQTFPFDANKCRGCRRKTDYMEKQDAAAAQEEFNPVKYAKTLLNKYTFKTAKDTETLYVFDKTNGIYTDKGEVLVKEEMTKDLDEDTRAAIYTDVIFYIKGQTYFDRPDNTDINKIAVTNGILDLTTHQITPHTPDFFTTTKLAVTYNQACPYEKTKQFITDLVGTTQEPIIQELLGYCLLRSYPYNYAFMFVGNGANGKSTILRLFTHFLGKENVATETLQAICYNRFAAVNLYEKLANISADLPANALNITGNFKLLTGYDRVSGEEKFQKAFSFWNYAKLIFSANKIPETKDDTDAYFRRWVIVTFNRIFIGQNAKPNILNDLTTPEALSGLLNYALLGLDRTLKQNGFSVNPDIEATREQYIRKSNSAKAFAEERLVREDGEIIRKDELYNTYLTFCQDNQLPALPKGNLTQLIPMTIPEARETQRRLDGPKKATTRVWENIKVVTELPTEVESEQTHLLQPENTEKTMEKDHEAGVAGVATPILCTDGKNELPKNNSSSVAGGSMVFPRIEREVVTPATVVTGERTCGDCMFIGTGACQFPSDPSSVKSDFCWAVNCQGFKSKEVNEGSIPL